MAERIEVSGVIPASPTKIYVAWLSSDGHAAMTGAAAEASDAVGGRFVAWDEYITGQNLELEPNRRIVQAWRTTEFPEEAPDSHLEILLQAERGGTRITFVHTNIPEGQGPSYEQGWQDFYLVPMAKHFGVAGKPPRAKVKAKKPEPKAKVPKRKAPQAKKKASKRTS
jgi:uncharacterized protein YndB with AHSA1/START domain